MLKISFEYGSYEIGLAAILAAILAFYLAFLISPVFSVLSVLCLMSGEWKSL